jgi:pimeloyl-ACP methyl ester carboxylesterase
VGRPILAEGSERPGTLRDVDAPDTPFERSPSVVARSRDGARIAAFRVTGPASGGRPLLLVHGTGSDHTTWRVAGPLLAAARPTWAMDRRGRGDSTDGPAYAAAREAEDLAGVAEALATRHGEPVAVLGHSLGGRLALAAALRTDAIDRVIAYEGAPTPDEARGDAPLLARLRADLDRGDPGAVLARFLTEAAGLPDDELDAFRASPLWRVRVATAPLIVRELEAALHDPAIGLDAVAQVGVPVLQLTGTVSPPAFREGAAALHARLARGSLAAVDGAGHAAHHAHAPALVAAVIPFLDR